MMKRIVAALFFLSLFLVAVALIAPGFIDWSKHKDTILSQLEPYIARKLQVDGKVSFRVIPSPEIVLENVTLANAEGAKAPHFMKLKQLEARMKLQPLLQGKFEIETINLASPEVNLETLPEGGNNWTGIFRDQQGATRPGAVQLNNMSMTDGTFHYQNPATGAEWFVEDLDLAVTAETLHGPFKAKGGMHYGGTRVAIEGGTGKYEPGTPLPVNVTLAPAETLPKMTFSGVADLSAGVDLQGELSVSQGTIASLFNNDFLREIDFLSDAGEATAMLNMKSGEVSLTDIKGKVGKKGEFSGKVTMVFATGKKPEVVADVEGHDLKVTGKPGFLDIPASFVPHVKAKLKSVTWGGVWLPGVTLSLDASDKEWIVKEARIDLPGKSVLKLAGVVTPKTKYGAFSIQATSQDAPKMAKSGLGDNNILKSLAASGLVKKLDVAASLDVRPDKLSLFDLDAKLDDDTKVTGVLNITRGKPAFDAKLNVDKGDIAAVMSDKYAVFMGSILKSDASLEITVKNFTKGDLAGADLAFKGKTEGGVLRIENMTGTLGPSGNFAISGKAAGVNPVSGMELEYSLKASPLGGLSAYGVEIPPPLWGSNAVDVKGRVAGDTQKYSFTVDGAVQGADVSLAGNATAGNQGTYSYQTDVKMKNATWAQIGLPVDNLLAEGKPFNFAAKLAGTRTNYQFDNLNAGGVTGSLGRRDGRYSGDLDATAVDFDKWLWENWKVTDAFELKLKAKKLGWRSDDDVENAQLTLEAAPDSIKVTDAKAEIWGGNISADVESARVNGKWKGKMTGKILGADLQKLHDLLEFKGMVLGQGDISIDLTDDDSKTDKDWFAGMDGTLGLTADSLTVQDFSPGALAKLVDMLNGVPTDDFTSEALRALRSEDTTYNNVNAAFKVGGGKIVIDKMKLSDADANVDVKGDYTLGPETFTIAAGVQLKRPAGAPAFNVNRSGEMDNAPTYTAALRPLENWLAKAATPTPAPVPVPMDDVPQNPVPPPVRLDVPPLNETVILPENTPEPPVQIYPPPDKPLPQDIDEPPTATPENETTDVINREPIDTEQLAAPPQDQNMNMPSPPQPPTPPQGDMKGVFDRLNSLPEEPEPPAEDFTLQKPDTPKPEEEEILPRD